MAACSWTWAKTAARLTLQSAAIRSQLRPAAYIITHSWFRLSRTEGTRPGPGGN